MKEKPEIVLAEPRKRRHIPAHSALKNQLFFFLKLEDALLDRAPDNETNHSDGLVLTEAVDSVHGLLFYCRIPPKIGEWGHADGKNSLTEP